MFCWSVFIVLSLMTPRNVTESVCPERPATASQECLVLSLFLLSPPFPAILCDKLLSLVSVKDRDNLFKMQDQRFVVHVISCLLCVQYVWTGTLRWTLKSACMAFKVELLSAEKNVFLGLRWWLKVKMLPWNILVSLVCYSEMSQITLQVCYSSVWLLNMHNWHFDVLRHCIARCKSYPWSFMTTSMPQFQDVVH